MYRFLTFLLLLTPIWCEIVDRIAITVEHQVITELQIDEELRVTAFLNHAAVAETVNERRAAADRIVEQMLVAREMALSHYPEPQASDVDKFLIKVEQTYGTHEAYEAALQRYLVTEATLKTHLATQLRTLSFIELRFRPDLGSGASDPAAIQKREQLTDQILDTWLEEARKQVDIVYLDKALQ